MKIKALILTALAASSLTMASSSAIAEPHGYGDYQDMGPHHADMQRKPPRGAMFKHVLRELDLNEEQKQKVKAIIEAEKGQGKALRQQIGELKQQMHQILKADTSNESQLRNLAGQVANLKVDLMLKHRAIFEQIKQELTPEQLEQLEEMQQKREQRRQQRREKRANR